jgi:uncharacterized OB-fold protein
MTELDGSLRPHNIPPAEAEGSLALQQCTSCGRHPSFPRIRCPFCFGELTWKTSVGTGTIIDLAIVRRTHDARYEPYVPIVMAHIALSEGVETIATIIGENRLAARIGHRVVACAHGSWSTLPQFELIRPPSEAVR